MEAEPVLTKCGDCGADVDSTTTTDVDGTDVCETCLTEYFKCEECTEYVRDGDGVIVHTRSYATAQSDKTVCATCADDCDRCDKCDELYSNGYVDRVWVDGDRLDVCYACRDDLYWCDRCNEYTTYECEHSDEDFDDYELGHYQDDLTFYHTKAEAKDTAGRATRLYLGWELETEMNNSGCGPGWMRDNLGLDYVGYKEDGSLDDGVEIVSHPMTWGFIRERTKELTDALAKMVKAGIRSYQTDTCGMHVHLSRDAFSSLHLYKFLTLVYQNPDLTTRVSQRVKERLSQWASLTAEKLTDSPKRMLQKARTKDNMQYCRYVAVNLEPAHTIEIRIFRGTLHAPSFFKNLEYCAAAYQFTKMAGMNQLTERHFTQYVQANKREFPNLHAFLTGKPVTAPTAA